MAGRRGFGNIKRMRSGRYQARYTHRSIDYSLGTFGTKKQAESALSRTQRDIDEGTWVDPAEQARLDTEAARVEEAEETTLRQYADLWVKTRMVKGKPLADLTRWGYAQILRDHIYPTFGDTALSQITRADVNTWHSKLLPKHPTQRSRTYDLLRAIMNSAVDDELLDVNPVRIRGASTTSRESKTVPATVDQVADITAAIPEQWQLTITLATWCTLRVGELLALQRRDVRVDPSSPTNPPRMPVTRLVVDRRVYQDREKGGRKVDDGAKAGSEGTVSIPPHVVPAVFLHLTQHVGPEPTDWLFTSSRDSREALPKGTLYDPWYYRAREAVGRADLRFHDLRHTGNLYAAESGATLAELMERMRHRTVRAALRYMHTAGGSADRLAERMSEYVAPKRSPTRGTEVATPAAESVDEKEQRIAELEAELRRLREQ
ncbi:tyrosine-type recombinase/integrase [Tsukamurella pseudospumae]|uniref:Tyr recombinase domain-containing protein n=1 Tax=Tsukamurella pseudospumae TaxID=239498 RepID=A0A138A8F2_9ACTN|nr:site-specific integrase [Tsukamurella pseudospumae]KXP06745.1 hypothetical protein AXK60_11820 [Tsukamurella pseudospumae]